jgi:hypothetical protein
VIECGVPKHCCAEMADPSSLPQTSDSCWLTAETGTSRFASVLDGVSEHCEDRVPATK